MRRLLAGFVAAYLLLQATATALGSTRGEAGLIVGAIVVMALLAVERLLFHRPLGSAVIELGLGPPARRGVTASLAIGAALLLVLPAYAVACGARLEMYPGWIPLIAGLFAQAGIAEETLFRGYLFQHLRRNRTFWRAATISMGPFVLVHSILFFTLPWTVALAAIGLAVIVSFPLAHLFELGGRTVWAPAIVHFVIQAAIKIVIVPGPEGELLPVIWMAASALIPFAAFLIPESGR